MKKKSTIARFSLSDIEALRERGEDPTRPDAPRAESLGKDFWKSARVVMPAGKTSVHLRLDLDVVEWFKALGQKARHSEERPPSRLGRGAKARPASSPEQSPLMPYILKSLGGFQVLLRFEMRMAHTIVMARVIRYSALIALCVFFYGAPVPWAQSSKGSEGLAYSSFHGQPPASEDLLLTLVRQVRWDTRKDKWNADGLSLRFEKVEGQAPTATGLARYRVFAEGAPENKLYVLGVWVVGKKLQYGSQDLYVNAQGLLMIHRPTRELEASFKAPGDELELMPQTSNAEPVRYILSSKDQQLSILGTLVPHPVVARDQDCTLEVRLAEPDAAAVLLVANGFPAEAKIPLVLESEGETANLTMVTDSSGSAEVADFPTVSGKAQGTLKATAEGSDCLPSVLMPWGAGTLVEKTP